ncbi:glutamate racemase [Vibrio salinus]|uniref:glutamate racemase n=1 Tax=Vibrio salinus TaxID=2899784 RepID=UPI0027E38C39|nr:glutamate racemase [Vibrio salinus]
MFVNSTVNILLFDSGVGGLSVFQKVKQKLPECNYTYLYDNEGYPYGELPESVLIDRVVNLVSRVVAQEAIDLVVIACNTASTIALPDLRRTLTIPVVGVVPAIKPACLAAEKAVGLIATPATVKRDYINILINEFSNNIPVHMLGSTALVNMAENKLQGKAVNLDSLTVELYGLKDKIDVAVLGCTHFPLIREEIKTVLGPAVKLIDSGEAIARRVVDLLGQSQALRVRRVNKAFSTQIDDKSIALEECLNWFGFNVTDCFPYQ